MPRTTSAPRTTRTALPPPVAQGCPYVAVITPHEEGERQAEAMETWLQACASDEPFALELVGTQREQRFVLRASCEAQLTLLCKQFEAQYPQVEIARLAPSADPLVLHSGEQALIGEFALSNPSWLPLKTFSGKALAEPGGDPLAGILAAMETVGSGERIISQLALVRAPENWIAADIRKAVEHPLQGERESTQATRRQGPSDNAQGLRLLLGIAALLSVLYGYHASRTGAVLPLILLGLAGVGLLIFLFWRAFRVNPQAIYDMKLVADKLMRAAFTTRLRVIVIGGEGSASEEQLRAHLGGMEVAYRQFTLSSANSLVLTRIRSVAAGEKRALTLPRVLDAFPYLHLLRRFLHGGAYGPDTWNILEIVGAYHLPQSLTDLPLVRRLRVKRLLFSPEVAHAVAHMPGPLPPARIGTSRHRGQSIPVLLPFATLLSHKFLVGRSRSGKSVLIQLLSQAAMAPVRDRSLQPGMFVIDPHHDLIEDLLRLVPPSRLNDVRLLDFTETQFPVALNPLDATMGFTRDQAISNLMSAFERIWSDFWGPRMAFFLKNVCLLLSTLNEDLVRQGRTDEQYTLLDINPLLQYQDYAMRVLNQLNRSETWHQELLAWWQHTYFTLPKNSSFRQEVIMPILSKMGVFNDNQHLRRIVGQPVTTAPVHEAVSGGRIVLCALASRDMDDAAVNILGSTLINLLHRAFLAQHTLPLAARRRVFVAVDEFQAFPGSSYDKLLSEDAKYGCALLLATQSLKRLHQIKEGLLEMVFANCEHLFAFGVSAADAKLVEAELHEQVGVKHIISQPPLHCYARLAMSGHPLQIASVTLAEPESWQPTPAQTRQVEDLRRRQRGRLRPASEVDRLHTEHLSHYLDVSYFASLVEREVHQQDEARTRREEANARLAQVNADAARLPAKADPPVSASTQNPSASGAQAAPGSGPGTTRSARAATGGTASASTASGAPASSPQQGTAPSPQASTMAPSATGSGTMHTEAAGKTTSDHCPPQPSATGSGTTHTEAATGASDPPTSSPKASQGHKRKTTRSRRLGNLRTVTKTPVGEPLPDVTRDADGTPDGQTGEPHSLTSSAHGVSRGREREHR